MAASIGRAIWSRDVGRLFLPASPLTSTSQPVPGRLLSVPVLALALVAISSAALWVRLADAPAVVTAFWRVALSTVILWAVQLRRWPRLSRAGWRSAAFGGLMLALHFWSWMLSLQNTSVLSSTLLVTSTPLWLALFGRWLPGEKPLVWQGWLGLIVALGGSTAMLLEGSRAGGSEAVTLAGSVQALLGALFGGLYWLAGRSGRQQDEVGDLSVVSTGIAALALAVVVFAQGHAFVQGVSVATWQLWLILAIFPQLIGHNGLLWALRHWSATAISVLVLLEPVIATGFASLWGEASPSPRAWVAAMVAVAGVGAVVWHQRTPETEANADAS